MPLPDAEQVRASAVPALAVGAEVERLDLAVAAADAALAAICMYPRNDAGARTLESSAYTLYYRGPEPSDAQRLVLGIRPVTLTTVAADTSGDWTYASTASLTTDVLVEEYTGNLYVRPSSTWSFSEGTRANKVTCDAGFDVSAEPPLVLAIALLVAHWISIGTIGTQVQAYSQGGMNATYRQESIPAAVRALVDPYRLVEREIGWRHR